jgi:hypothetical protein
MPKEWAARVESKFSVAKSRGTFLVMFFDSMANYIMQKRIGCFGGIKRCE